MPPTTISTGLDARIEGIIDRLEQFGDTFSDIIEELRAISAQF